MTARAIMLSALPFATALALLLLAVLQLAHLEAIAWDVRLPWPAFALLPLGLTVLGVGLGIEGARIARGRVTSRRALGVVLASGLGGAGALAALWAVEKYYGEPSGEVSLASFDSSAWEVFDATAWAGTRRVTRERLEAAWGAFPERLPLVARERTRDREAGYTLLELVLGVESSGEPAWDEMPVTLLLPETPRARPAPAVIVHHQHAGRFDKARGEPCGVRGDPRQAIGPELARRGIVVACHDALGFGERQGAGEDRIAMELVRRGRTINGKYAFDVSRLVDYLVTRDDVDSERIGIVGHSLGGQMAVFAALFDPRIGVVASSCGFGRFAGPHSMLSTGHVYAQATYLPGFLVENPSVEMRHLVGLLAPRPLLLSAGARDDLFPIEGVAEIHAFVTALYAHEGRATRLVTLRHRGSHLLPRSIRERIAAFLEERWP